MAFSLLSLFFVFQIPLEAERPMANDLVLELYLQPGSPLASGFRLDAFNAIKPRVTHSPSSDIVDIWDPTSIIMEDRHVSPAVLYIQVSVLQVIYLYLSLQPSLVLRNQYLLVTF